MFLSVGTPIPCIIIFSILNKEQLFRSSQVLLGTESNHNHDWRSCKNDYPIVSGVFQQSMHVFDFYSMQIGLEPSYFLFAQKVCSSVGWLGRIIRIMCRDALIVVFWSVEIYKS
jgi:hypothetical protein